MSRWDAGLHIRAERVRFLGDGIKLGGYQILPGSPNSAVVENLQLRTVEEGASIPDFATLTNSAAQELMDDLWRCGLRPTEGSGSAGSLAATERHLRDFRALLFAKLNVEVPK